LALLFLVVLALLFAPARNEELDSVSGADDPVGARVLAPTVREGIVTTGPKHSPQQLQVPDQRSELRSIQLTLASVAAALLLASLTWSARQESRAAPGLVTLRARVPRAPPSLPAA
jgi:hypothetical protein